MARCILYCSTTVCAMKIPTRGDVRLFDAHICCIAKASGEALHLLCRVECIINFAMGMLIVGDWKDASPVQRLLDMLQSQPKSSRPVPKARGADKDEASQAARGSRTVRKSSAGDGPAQRASR